MILPYPNENESREAYISRAGKLVADTLTTSILTEEEMGEFFDSVPRFEVPTPPVNPPTESVVTNLAEPPPPAPTVNTKLIKTGSFVSWITNDGKIVRGKVERVQSEGLAALDKGSFGVHASGDNPAAFIRVYEMKDTGYQASDRRIVENFSNLTRLANLPKQHTKGKQVYVDKINSDTAEISIYADIGGEADWGGINENEFKAEIEALGPKIKNVTMRLSSLGGDVWTGLGIHNQIRLDRSENGRTWTCLIDSVCASAATFLAMAADKVIMSDLGDFMIHRAMTFTYGNRDDLQEVIDRLDVVDQKIVQMYETKTGLPSDQLQDMLGAETWMSAAEAQKLGFVDEVYKGNKLSASANYERKWIHNAPKRNARQELDRQIQRVDNLLASKKFDS